MNEAKLGRAGRALVALSVSITAALALAVPAGAANGHGAATIVLADHAKGRTLSGQGVKVVASAPATKADRTVTLPISAVDPAGEPSAAAAGGLSFKRGKRTIALGDLRFDLEAGSLVGTLGRAEIPVFRLGAAASVDSASGAVSLANGKLRLTEVAATLLRDKLGLRRALVRKGVGSIGISAKADPAHAAARPIVSGGVTWGIRAALRGYVLSPPVGSIAIADGATASGPLNSPATVFGFPGASGSFVKGLYGASDKLVLRVLGNVKLAKPGHCIEALRFANLEVKLDGASSAIGVDTTFDEGPAPCPDGAPVTTEHVELGKLDPSGVSPTYSADGQTVTWTAVPAAVTAAGETAFGGFLKAGAELEPITISVGLG
jgi:Htaa protein